MDKVIFWDFDGTLVHSNTRFVDALAVTLKQYGYFLNENIISQGLKKIFPWLNYDIAYPDKIGDWWNRFFTGLNAFYTENKIDTIDHEKINTAFQNIIIHTNDYALYPDTKQVLSQCIELGYKNYLLSNNFPELTKFLDIFHLTQYFSDIIISSHVGYEKPRKELFDYAKKLANCQIGIMVGDNPIADILGGKENGLKTILVHNRCPSVADYTFDCLTDILKIL